MPTQVETGNIKPRIQFTADGEQKEFQFFFTIYEPENVKVYIEDVLQISFELKRGGSRRNCCFCRAAGRGKTDYRLPRFGTQTHHGF